MKKGEKYKGIVLDRDEVFTPFGENILVEKWLDLDFRVHLLFQ